MPVDPGPYAELLSQLEWVESRLLTWGVVDGSFTQEEICDEIERFQAVCGLDEDPRELLDNLVERHFVFEFREAGTPRYRTRMAEAVRLFSRLRQIRPWNTWQSAPTLVADFRFAVGPRLYPKRHVASADAISQVRSRTTVTAIEQKALSALLRDSQVDALTLSSFQVEATAQALGDLRASTSRGMVVTAGTGTGKTKAFYLPALSHIAGLVSRDAHWTKALALYPRNELLKDQYSETYSEVQVLNHALRNELPRRITLGVLFQDTPNSARLDDLGAWNRNGHFVCSSLRCPQCSEGAMEWKRSDMDVGHEALTCMSCGFRSSDGDLVLTRKSLDKRPPDVLFSSTEMLNRSMSDSRRAALFGVGKAQAPRVVLLDEVHTYGGRHGAQVAYLLRRWRCAIRQKVQFTGLSATLENARDFFAQLTGLRASSVAEIPGSDLEPRGVEYQLALRGDPVSATALLSTTIQSAMLARRILDPAGREEQESLFGHRVYAFTDNLDVVNRLYFDLRDAEGDGRSNPGRTLAEFRQHHTRERPRERLRHGQSWKLCEDVGHNLSRLLRVRRTSSQDRGVDRNADIIVATASLEVGYNDPAVGAVIQHKAPRDLADFLQRKGRAGRRPEMRPWTIVSLSDYGRDRFTYESYDQLFRSQLPSRSLPTGNRYTLRMQAVFALMDWLALKIPKTLRDGSVWRDFTGPAAEPWKERQRWHLEFLRRLLENPDIQNELGAYLRDALRIDLENVTALLWEPPRSILMSVVPTLVRRLETDWRRIPLEPGEVASDIMAPSSPLPDFVPAALFQELSMPEVQVEPRNRGRKDAMPLLNAMQTVAPGNVTRRFAPHDDCLHWFAPPNLNVSRNDMAVEAWCAEHESLGEFQLVEDGQVRSVPCFRPLRFHPTEVPPNVRATSKGFLRWRSQIFATATGNRYNVPRNSPWSLVIDHIEFYTHMQNSHVTVRRFAVGGHAHVGLIRGHDTERQVEITFRQGNTTETAGVGFTQDVDGIAVRFRYPDDLHVGIRDANQEKIRSFRTAYFRHRVRTDPTLRTHANDFQLDWLYQMYLSAVSAEALERGLDLAQAHEELLNHGLGAAMTQVLDVIFPTIRLEQEEVDEVEGGGVPEQKMRERLEGLASNSELVARIAELAVILWQDPKPAWYEWARERFRATLSGALLEAVQRCSSEVDIDSLWLDLHPGPPPIGVDIARAGEWEEIWITEQTFGGSGIVEEVLRRYSEDPMRFLRLAEEALGPGDFEWVDSELTRLAHNSQKPKLRAALRQVRNAVTNAELRESVRQLRNLLEREGFLPNHAVMTALQARVLRPGTDENFDAELADILDQWRREEERLGIEIDLRVMAYVFGCHRNLGQALPFLPEANLEDPQWRYQAYSSILWPRGNVVRNQKLAWWNPFASVPPVDRFLVLDCLETDRQTVDVGDPNWREKIRAVLADRAEATLVGPLDQPVAMKRALLSLVCEPLEVGFLYVFPQIEGARRHGAELELRLVCREAIR